MRRRPMLLAALTAPAFLVTLVTLVLIPQRAQRVARAMLEQPVARPDTILLRERTATAAQRERSAAAALDRARAANAARLAVRAPVDTLPPALRARRDTLAVEVASLGPLLDRAADAPLLSSYQLLGAHPALRDDPRVVRMLDTLSEIDKQRALLGAVGGIDPAYVALTARAAEIGVQIQEIAEAKRQSLRAEFARLAAPRVAAPPPAIDTVPLNGALDSAAAAVHDAAAEMAHARAVLAMLEQREAKAREVASMGASPAAMLMAAVVIALATGFCLALIGEIRHPRVADQREAELVTGAAVLTRIRPGESVPDRARRSADRALPPAIEPAAERYRVLYTQLADAGFRLPLVMVAGDRPLVTAAVSTNLAAAAARTARTALAVDLDLWTHSLSAVLGVPIEPGIADVVLPGGPDWPEAVVSVLVGRERSMSVIPAGRPAVTAWRGTEQLSGDPAAGEQSTAAAHAGADEMLRTVLERIARRHDCVVVNAPGVPAPRPVAPEAIVCALRARTSIASLQQLVTSLRDHGVRLRGLVLWESDEPLLAPQAERARRGSSWTAAALAGSAQRPG